MNKEAHQFDVPVRFANLTAKSTFGSYFGMENCLIQAKDVTEFVYHTKQEAATGLFLLLFYRFE